MRRAAFAALFFGVQAVLIATAGPRPQHAFGFRMFADFATIRVSLSRRLGDGRVVPVVGQGWTARDRFGWPHRVSWYELVKPNGPMQLDVTVRAPYGAGSQVAVLARGLDWALAHLPDDAETVALIADVTLHTNRHAAEHVTIERKR